MQFRFTIPRWTFLTAAVLVLVSGCGESADESPTTTPPSIAPAASTPAADSSSTTDSVAANASKADADDVAPTPGESAASDGTKDSAAEPVVAKPSLADYVAPFPDRIELFVAPKRQGGARTPDGEDQDAVELLGFVNVDRSKVVLSINGQVTPAAVGETLLGVEVISIDPPTVVLQRGRQRWSASLDN